MGNVYRQDSQLLHELLDKASTGNGATLLIPDLQRPFVWTPNQVTLLIDSLIRGWPFGTLLLWKVHDQQLQGIPFRPFWTLVDRTKEVNGGQVGQMNPPAQYHMVLDGQQRVQSLLLALGGDDWGFKLYDRDWVEEIKEERQRGRRSKYQHWSKASLCFDLHSFLAEYNNEGHHLLAVDFRKVLFWVVTDPQDGQSSFPKPLNYEEPLEKMTDPKHLGRFIRLSRLWAAALPNSSLMEAQFRQIAKPLLEQHGVQPDVIGSLLAPLGELMSTLRDVKLAEVAFLELQPFDANIFDADTYNDAIVSIFTRLNTAGRTLEREEIILAWLKVGWNPIDTNGQTAGECFLNLQKELHGCKLDIKLDPLVSAVSFLWSVSENEGRLLANSDLLKGDIIRPMALALSRRWKFVSHAIDAGSRTLYHRSLEFGPSGHFSSVYALAVLWAWLYTAEIWKHNHSLSELQRDDFEKRCDESLSIYIDRWILCSQWAGVWSGSSTTTIEGYAKKLADLIKSMEAMDSLSSAHDAWDECFKTILETLTGKATEYINTLTAPSRERVGVYRDPLWIWHRLDSDRWEKSQVQLRVGKRKSACEVDHVVSFSLWEKSLASGLPGGITDEDDAQAVANKLGNCALLEKNFNISKSKDPLKQFLSRTHEVVKGKLRIDSWCAALGIPKPMLDPDSASVDEIKQAIDSRDEEIKTELSEFIKGQKARKDVDTPGTELSQPIAITLGVPVEMASHHSSDAQQMESVADVDSVTSALEEQENEAVSTESEITPRGDVDVVGLRDAYSKDEGIRLVIDHFAARERNQHVTNADTLVSALQRSKTPLSRPVVIRALRSLDALGLGRFVAGRKGYATRFEWHEQSLSIREMASQEAAKDESESND